MLNNDCVAEAGWAQALVDAASRAPASCGMLQSLMVFLDRPGTINSTGIELTALGNGRDRHRDRSWPNDDSKRPAAIFCPTAGAAAYRRAMLDQIRLSTGYFDRNHFMYLEDLDLGWRARLAGWDALYVPDSVVRHRWHGSTDRHGASWLAVLSGINRVRTQLKNASPSLIARTSPVTLVETLEIGRHAGFDGLRRLKQAVRESLAPARKWRNSPASADGRSSAPGRPGEGAGYSAPVQRSACGSVNTLSGTGPADRVSPVRPRRR